MALPMKKVGMQAMMGKKAAMRKAAMRATMRKVAMKLKSIIARGKNPCAAVFRGYKERMKGALTNAQLTKNAKVLQLIDEMGVNLKKELEDDDAKKEYYDAQFDSTDDKKKGGGVVHKGFRDGHQ